MAAAKKGKKTSKSKKSSTSKKKGNKLNFFSKLMLILLTAAVIITAVFLTLNNFNINKDKTPMTEVSVKDTEKETKDTEKETTRQNKEDVKPKPKEEKQQTSATDVKEESKQQPKIDNKEGKKHQEKVTTDLKKDVKETKILNGCWLSSEQGASLTIDEYGYRIDFFGIDASKPITGDYHIKNNLIIFTSDDNICGKAEGSYRITFYKNNFSLICKDDDCSSRRNILEADWEWMEI